MTTIRPGTAVVPYADITLTGTPAQISRAIHQPRSTGQLVTVTTPRPVSATDPRYRTHLVVHATGDPPPANPPLPPPIPDQGPPAAPRPGAPNPGVPPPPPNPPLAADNAWDSSPESCPPICDGSC